MATVADVLEGIERIAPLRWALSFDRVGLQVGRRDSVVERGIVSLDWSVGLLEAAVSQRAQIIVCHHPLIWEPMAAIDDSSRAGRFALRLIENGMAFIGCHTNWDAAPGGINDTLAEILELTDVAAFGDRSTTDSFKLVTFCPPEAVDTIVDALEEVGAGTIGNYDRCAFQSRGIGTFRGAASSQPTIGEAGRQVEAEEVRVEMLVPAGLSGAAIDALYRAHPYEEPAFDLLVRKDEGEMPLGRIGDLPAPMKPNEFQAFLDQRLETRSWHWGTRETVQRIALCGGAADSMWRAAEAVGADAFVTGEVKQNIALDASECGLDVFAAGHFATEQPGMDALRRRLDDEVQGVQWSLYEPNSCQSGKPA